MSNPTKDNIYAYALAKTLTKVSSPATVGVYSSCQDRINMILGQMEVYMDKEAVRIEKEHNGRPRSVKPSFTGFLALVGRLLFYRPIWTQENQQYHDIRFIYVHFSAWHFAGSDLLWAGLVIRLFQAMQMNFGKLQLVLYRVAQHDEEEEIMDKTEETGTNHWRSKKMCCCPLWFFVLCIVVVPLIILVLILAFGLPNPEVTAGEELKEADSKVGVLEGVVIAALGVPAASALRFIFLMAKNLIFSQDLNIKKGMDNDRVSSQLGFMNEVRKEMWFLSRFIQFMEMFERRRIRVVLRIANLDRCAPKKIVAVLDAINILLSDEESPFISILAVNPFVLVQKVNFADGCFSREDRAYALLNRIVTLAFTVPPLCDDSKRSLFYSLASNSKLPEDKSMGKDKRRTGDPRKTSSSDLREVHTVLEELKPLQTPTTPAEVNVNEEEVEMLVSSILNSSKGNINKYMFDDAMTMRRVINSIRVTVIIMKALNEEPPEPLRVAAWVILANQWPCRLSWIIQCVEDAQQRAAIDPNNVAGVDDSKTLWEIFSESRGELFKMSAQIEDLLEQDGDPEMFETFLRADFRFSVWELRTFEVATVNLDHAVKKELAQIRGMSRLKGAGWMRDVAPLPITTIIDMDTKDVCKELERMKYPREYIDKVKSNDINGLELLFGNVDYLKGLLGMTSNEWATFRLHFPGLPSRLRLQNHELALEPSHPQNPPTPDLADNSVLDSDLCPVSPISPKF